MNWNTSTKTVFNLTKNFYSSNILLVMIGFWKVLKYIVELEILFIISLPFSIWIWNRFVYWEPFLVIRIIMRSTSWKGENIFNSIKKRKKLDKDVETRRTYIYMASGPRMRKKRVGGWCWVAVDGVRSTGGNVSTCFEMWLEYPKADLMVSILLCQLKLSPFFFLTPVFQKKEILNFYSRPF